VDRLSLTGDSTWLTRREQHLAVEERHRDRANKTAEAKRGAHLPFCCMIIRQNMPVHLAMKSEERMDVVAARGADFGSRFVDLSK
jgi:hypothetical protein